MAHAFHKIRLEARELYPLVTARDEMKLSVTERTATITGIGFAPDIAEAFATLLGEWKAVIPLSRESIKLDPGTYTLALIGRDLYASRGEEKLFLPVGPVEVEVFSAKG